MKPTALALALLCLAPPLVTQESAARPKRSLAEGLVRQLIEREELRPPYLESGLEMGAGQGAMVLMVRRASGALELHEIERGRGDHGPAAKKQEIAEPGKEEREGQAAAKAAQAKGGIQAVLALQLKWLEGQVTLGTVDDPTLVTGKAVDRAQLKPVMQRLFALTRNSEFEGQVVIEIDSEVSMQEVFATQEVARTAGFTLVMYGNRKAVLPASAADRELIAGIPAKYDWPVERLFPDSPLNVCEGELLILLDGPSTWADIGPLYMEFARVGIWQIGFVGQKDGRTRFKLPANLPFDRGH